MNARARAEWMARNSSAVVFALAPVLWALLIAWLVCRAT